MRKFILVLLISSSWIHVSSVENKEHFHVQFFLKEFHCNWYPELNMDTALLVSVNKQRLYLLSNYMVIDSYPISTSKYGLGSTPRSFKTPLGMFELASKHGDGIPKGTVFYNAEPSKEVAEILYDDTDIQEDKIITRVIRLRGLEEGRNKGVGCDTYDRRIYIHGTPEEGLIGRPASHGCIRMRNDDVIALFDQVEPNYKLLIVH